MTIVMEDDVTGEKIDACEIARQACDCNECGGGVGVRKDGDCLHDVIEEAIRAAVDDAIRTKARTPEWWATYNAAVTGLMTARVLTIYTSHADAAAQADYAHHGKGTD